MLTALAAWQRDLPVRGQPRQVHRDCVMATGPRWCTPTTRRRCGARRDARGHPPAQRRARRAGEEAIAVGIASTPARRGRYIGSRDRHEFTPSATPSTRLRLCDLARAATSSRPRARCSRPAGIPGGSRGAAQGEGPGAGVTAFRVLGSPVLRPARRLTRWPPWSRALPRSSERPDCELCVWLSLATRRR